MLWIFQSKQKSRSNVLKRCIQLCFFCAGPCIFQSEQKGCSADWPPLSFGQLLLPPQSSTPGNECESFWFKQCKMQTLLQSFTIHSKFTVHNANPLQSFKMNVNHYKIRSSHCSPPGNESMWIIAKILIQTMQTHCTSKINVNHYKILIQTKIFHIYTQLNHSQPRRWFEQDLKYLIEQAVYKTLQLACLIIMYLL